MSTELTAVEAARAAGIRLDVIYPMLRAGRLRARKVNGQWRVSASALAAHVSKRRRKTLPIGPSEQS